MTISKLIVARLIIICVSLTVAAPGVQAQPVKSSLKGGVQDQGRMSPSVTLTVPPANQTHLHSSVDVKQYAGSQTYRSGQPAPIIPVVPQPRPISFPLHVERRWAPPPIPPNFSFRQFRMPSRPIRWDYTLTPRNGIMTWTPGYETKVLSRPPYRRTVLELFNTHASLSHEQLWGKPMAMQQVTARPVSPGLQAVPMVMKPSATMKPVRNWDEWYDRVAHAVYDVWQQTEAGAGTALVKVTAYPSRDVDCRIEEFTPVKDLARDVEKESRFREAAIRSVNALNRSPVWAFPATIQTPRQVVFDLELKHEVGSPAGCRIVRVADSGS